MNLRSTTKTSDISLVGEGILYDTDIFYDEDIFYNGLGVLISASNKIQSLVETTKIFSTTKTPKLNSNIL